VTTTGERLRTYWGERQFETTNITAFLARYWEPIVYFAIVSVALGLRLWDLDGRAVHHDEGIHNWYSWRIAEGAGYEHDPVYHGPLKYIFTAGIFTIFGANDTTARLLYALSGTVLVALPFFFRNYLGRKGAILASFLLAVSPVVLYVSRFARDDILVVTYAVAMAIVMWRYLKEQKESYLYAIPLLLMLGFVTMEAHFIVVAIFLVYLDLQLANDLVDQMRASRSMTQRDTIVAYALLLPTAWLIAALWPIIDGPRQRWSLTTMPPAGHLIIITGTFTLPHFAAAIQKVPEFIGKVPGVGDSIVEGLNIDALRDRGHRSPDENRLMQFTVILLLVASAYIGLLWNARVWAIGAVIFFVPYILFFTTGFTNMGGFWSGMWGQLDYWLAQQFERRGDQPDYYYLMHLPIYEFLPLLIALGGTLFYAFRGKMEQVLLTAASLLLILAITIGGDSLPLIGAFHVHLCFLIAIVTVLLLPFEDLTKFLFFWALSMLFALSVAGEKMPWLIIHVTVPMILLAAKLLDDLLTSIGEPATAPEPEPAPAPRGRRKAAAKAPPPPTFWERVSPYAPFLYVAALALVATVFFIRFGPASVFSLFPWFFSLAAVGVVIWVGSRFSWRLAMQVSVIAFLGSMLVFTLRASAIAAYDQGARGISPPELLIYAQGSPDLPAINQDIADFARETGRGKDLRIIMDVGNDTNVWPWPWYLRDYAESNQDLSTTFTPEAGTVVLASTSNRAKVDTYAEQIEHSEDYTHMWWFPPDEYRGLEVGQFLKDFFTGHYMSIWPRYFIDRELADVSAGPDRVAYFFGDFTPTEVAPAPVLDPASITQVGEGAGTAAGQFSQPGDIAVDAQGNLYVVDTLNRRIQRIDAQGQATVVGEAGSGPGQFGAVEEPADGPWGIGVDRQGNIYVADTWNHRIQKFGSDLNFIQEWGAQISPEHYETGQPDPFELFGPRDVTVDNDGNVLVVDTGNKRIVKYNPDGQFIQAYGLAGGGPGEFNEPSSIAVGLNGDIYVADYWNRRIQHFDAQFTFLDEVEMPGWGSQGITDRAYLTALPDGRVLATDPANGKVIVINSAGEKQEWRLIEGATRPIGIGADANGQVYITDSMNSTVNRVALATLLAPPPATAASPSPTPTAPLQ
jgi:predicted membrane-bound mannosyltransferase/DNA-binding beta-propeller fold protein YncE